MSHRQRQAADHEKEINNALYQLSVIARVMRSVTTADINAGRAACGSSVEWFAQQIELQHHRIDLALGELNRAGVTAPQTE